MIPPFKIDGDLKKWLIEYAKSQNRSLSAAIRQLIQEKRDILNGKQKDE